MNPAEFKRQVDYWKGIVECQRSAGTFGEGLSELLQTLLAAVELLSNRCEELQENIDRLERRGGL